MSNVDQMFLVITCADDSTALMGFVITERRKDGSVRWQQLATKENVENIIIQSTLSWSPEKLPVKSWRFVTEEERAMYEQREYRNALRDDGVVITHHMPTAREIHKEKMRQARAPLLTTLDLAIIRADEIRDNIKKTDIISQKQALRNVTDDPAIEAAQTIEVLRSVWPAILVG